MSLNAHDFYDSIPAYHFATNHNTIHVAFDLGRVERMKIVLETDQTTKKITIFVNLFHKVCPAMKAFTLIFNWLEFNFRSKTDCQRHWIQRTCDINPEREQYCSSMKEDNYIQGKTLSEHIHFHVYSHAHLDIYFQIWAHKLQNVQKLNHFEFV